jgi:hypothetical protein
MLVAPSMGAGPAGPMTMAQARDRVADAIELGELVAQRAPEGHPLFQVLEDAREVRDALDEHVPWYSDTGPLVAPGTRTYDNVERTVEAINAAIATVRNDPDQPLSRTLYVAPGVPWPALAVGAAGVVGLVALFWPRRKRAGR